MNYKIKAIRILLNEDCVLSKYYPLIPFKDRIIAYALENKIITKEECLKANFSLIFNNDSLSNLFKRFLVMYDNEEKLKILNKLNLDDDRLQAYKELFLLPGVKQTRAELYYLSGYKNLSAIASSNYEELLNEMKKAIMDNKLEIKLPLVKEVKTHIAVAKAFTL